MDWIPLNIGPICIWQSKKKCHDFPTDIKGSILLAEFTYKFQPVERGYANRTLYINLDDNTIYEKPVTQQRKDLPEVIEVIEEAKKKV